MISSAEEYLRILLRLDEGVLLINACGEIELANETFLRWFGLTNQVVGQTFASVLAGATIEELVALVRQKRGEATRELALESDAGKILLAIRASLLGENDDAPVLLLFQNVSAQRALEEVAADFVANVSHELRTPISILAGYIENLVDFPKMPRTEQAEIFATMQEHATRLKALLDDLLTLACFEARADVLDYTDLELRPFLRRLGRDWAPALASKQMAFVLEIADEVNTVRVDRFRFEQVMHNLFDNAFKYTPIEGRIWVRAQLVRQNLEISVEDNGAGIPEEDLPYIFERFYRVDKARSRKYGGTGLGLSIVKHIVTLHGGTVRAESTLPMSTRITITLPLSEKAPNESA